MDISYLIAILIAFLGGGVIISQKWLLNQGLNYRAMLAVNVCFFILFGSIYAWYHRKTIQESLHAFTPKIFGILGLQILLSTFLISILSYELLLRNDSYIAAGLTLIGPIFTVLFAKLILKEEINNKGIAGIIIILLGTWLVVQAKKEGAYSENKLQF